MTAALRATLPIVIGVAVGLSFMWAVGFGPDPLVVFLAVLFVAARFVRGWLGR